MRNLLRRNGIEKYYIIYIPLSNAFQTPLQLTLRFFSILNKVSFEKTFPSDNIYGFSGEIIGCSLTWGLALIVVKGSLASNGGDEKATPCLSCWDKTRTREAWPWVPWTLGNCSFPTWNILVVGPSSAELWTWDGPTSPYVSLRVLDASGRNGYSRRVLWVPWDEICITSINLSNKEETEIVKD